MDIFTSESAFLDVKTVSSKLGISQRSLRRLINEGEFPCVKIGRIIRIPKDKLNDYLDSHMEGGINS